MKLASVVAVLLGLGMIALADDAAPKHGHDGIGGQIVKVDGANVIIKKHARGDEVAKEVTVVTDDKTVVTIDKKDAKVADLKADLYVYVMPAEGTATKIVASTEKPKFGGGHHDGAESKPADK